MRLILLLVLACNLTYGQPTPTPPPYWPGMRQPAPSPSSQSYTPSSAGNLLLLRYCKPAEAATAQGKLGLREQCTNLPADVTGWGCSPAQAAQINDLVAAGKIKTKLPVPPDYKYVSWLCDGYKSKSQPSAARPVGPK